MSALADAQSNSQRSLLACKAAVSVQADTLMASGPTGLPSHRPDLAHSVEQLRHFKGHVYAAVRPIASKIAGQPIHVGRLKGTPSGTKAPDNVEPLTNHELIKLFSDPNPLQVAWSLMFTTVASLELTGRQLWWLPKKEVIFPVPTSWIKSFDGKSSFKSFGVQPPGIAEPIPLPADECCYFSFPSPHDPHSATSPLQAVAGSVDSDEAIITSQASMFRKGIHPAHAVIIGGNADGMEGKVKPRLSGAQERQIVEAIRRRYAGTHQNGDPLILDGLIEDVKVLSNTPREMDYLKSGEFARDRIYQGFGTSPIIAGLVEGSNRASSDAADRHFCTYVINPKIELFSQTMTSWLRVVFDDPTLVVWIKPCSADDAENSLRWASLLAQYGTVTGDELRALAPFELEQGKFPKPVNATAGAISEAAKALSTSVGYLSEPIEDVAARIVGEA